MAEKRLRIALAGNTNVGKSVIFNYLTGLHQHIGNWPGKTVEKAEGTLHFKGYTIDIIDLPGIYSLSTYSIEEQISREYITVEKPDVVINVVDASVLERNLYFTLQLMELNVPLVLALNQVDMAKKKGIEIDVEKLEKLLGIPVVPTVAIKGIGIFKLLERAVEIAEKRETPKMVVKFGKEVEDGIAKLVKMLEGVHCRYPPRYVAIRLLEGDEELEKEIERLNPEVVATAKKISKELEELHGHSCSTVIMAERYEIAGRIAREVQKLSSSIKPRLEERLHNLTTHKITGYVIMILSLLAIFYSIFTTGGYLSEFLNELFYVTEPLFYELFGTGTIGKLMWSVMEGVIAGITIALPYIVPFYIVLYFLEDSGYLSRIAFLIDNIMHKIGLHGKAIIPLILGYGCNVPACLGCRIMETERERLLAVFVTTLVPCAARTVIILGLVGKYLGIEYALALYIFNLAIIFALGRLAFKVLPGEPTALIMEMHDYRWPHLKTVLKQTWFRLLEFIKIAFPLIILGSFTIKLIEVFGLLEPIALALSPVTVTWLGLPLITGIALIFGVLRKELTLIMLATLFGTTNFAEVPGFGPIQMIVFTIVTMFYIPCISTIAALIKEIGWKKALIITIFEILFAITIGGIAYRILIQIFALGH
ncbi:MAG: ferrous iron transport protein B [Thaumarchaeota archaeon]|jgi:ferrous iron transport protein B|nr:ferrous iron transport protein B [Candidatus Terraquivivens yellowstonensis]MCL7392716.1 ferrous iron transport protein B [Candidatus Terraquivivens yellowstonensis]MCL7400252.1 ferrous iron transport protein B [Candidatus Terraquivivens yellowstonensis]